MIKVKKRKDEDFENLLKRFKAAIRRDGVLSSARSREAYEKPCNRRRRKRYESAIKAKKDRKRYSFG